MELREPEGYVREALNQRSSVFPPLYLQSVSDFYVCGREVRTGIY